MRIYVFLLVVCTLTSPLLAGPPTPDHVEALRDAIYDVIYDWELDHPPSRVTAITITTRPMSENAPTLRGINDISVTIKSIRGLEISADQDRIAGDPRNERIGKKIDESK